MSAAREHHQPFAATATSRGRWSMIGARAVWYRTWTVRLFGVLGLAAVLVSLGCNRAYYRKQADREASRLVLEKSDDPRWALPDFTIEMDPRSRFYDPYDPDHPPMPPDDPSSHELMHCVDGMKGYSHWHDNGDIDELENPSWRTYLAQYTTQTQDGSVKLRIEDAMRLALIHSPRYQQQLETVYLSALDTSTERFRFDVQFFGGNDTTFEHLGARRGPGGERNTLRTDTDLLLNRRFATAGELLVGFANSFVWQFFGPDTHVTTSLLNFSLIQPLLRAGGRAVALEQLTIAERTLLANLRAFQHFRQGFYTQLAIGSDGGVPAPRRRGGFLGGTGLTGFTGQGSGGFGGVGAATGFGGGSFGTGGGGGGGGAGGTFGAGGGAGEVGGFIGLLQTLQQLQNRQDSLNLQLRTLALLEANQQAGLIGLDQVLQFQQSIETERAQLLQAENRLQNALENFLISTLGLPPDLPVELDDSLVRPFQFIDPKLSALETGIADFIEEFGELDEPTIEDLQQAFERLEALRRRLTAQFEVVAADLNLFESRSDERQKGMSPKQRKRFLEDKQKLADDFNELKARVETTARTFSKLTGQLTPTTRRKSAQELVVLNTELLNLVGELSLIQARARLESVLLETIELSPQEALAIARANRLDWMNNRAALVDSWRLIEFNANALESNLDIFFEGDLGTLGGENLLRFRGPTGSLRAGVRFDAPLTRLLERNNFRQQLINYQQARRQLIQFEDNVNRGLRQTLRGLKQLEVNLEIQRRAVAIAVRRVDQARLKLAAPVPPVLPGQPPAQFGPTLTRDLVDALEALRDAQNNFMSVWLNYYAGRMGLMRDLGVMRIDENGLWIDEPLDEALRATGQEYPLPPPVPAVWFQGGSGPCKPDDAGDHFVPPAPTSETPRDSH